MTSTELQRSKDHEADALTFLGIVPEAANALTSAGRALPTGQSEVIEALAAFLAAAVPALVHAKLSDAAATRELAGVVDDMRRLLP